MTIKIIANHQVTYEQIISTDLWLESNAVDTFYKIFKEIPQVVYLMEQGYEPKISKWDDYKSMNLHIAYQFLIPESMLTWICLQWPEAVNRIDFDKMMTIVEDRNDYV